MKPRPSMGATETGRGCSESTRLCAARPGRWAIMGIQTAAQGKVLIRTRRAPPFDAKVSRMNRKFERPITAQAAVLTELRQRIIRGDLPPGRPIRQEVLAAELGMSRLPVREALVVLQAERLVDYTQHKGYVVAALDEDDLRQTHQLRDILESLAVEQAIPQLTEETIQAMRATLEDITRLESPTRIERIERNREFYFRLFAASNNRRLIALLSQLWDASDRYRALYFAETRDVERVQQMHESVIRAAEERDVERVQEILAERRKNGLVEALRVVQARLGNTDDAAESTSA